MRFKEIIKKIQEWGDNNPQVMYVNWGKIDEIVSIQLYPALYIQPISSSIDELATKYKFNIYFLDKITNDKQNRIDALNLTLKLLEDFANYFSIQWYLVNGFYAEMPIEWDYVDGELNDFVGGVVATVTFITNYNQDCQQPIYNN